MTWGKNARGRLGRSGEAAGKPNVVAFAKEEVPFHVSDLSCSHGSTLVVTNREYHVK